MGEYEPGGSPLEIIRRNAHGATSVRKLLCAHCNEIHPSHRPDCEARQPGHDRDQCLVCQEHLKDCEKDVLRQLFPR
jgi:hypothetical protein